MKLKRIAIIVIVLVVSLVATVLILLYYGKITALEGATTITVGVAVIRLVHIIINRILGDKVKEIDNELNIVYFPMLYVIDTFLKKRGWTRNTPATINDTSELENAIEDLIRIVKLKGCKIDDRIMTVKTRFFGHNSNTVYNLSVFSEFIELKIKELQDEKRRYT